MEHAELAAVHVSLTLYRSPYDREKKETSILRAKTIYKWDGATYVSAGRIERAETRVIGR
jgi:hypothetical protein